MSLSESSDAAAFDRSYLAAVLRAGSSENGIFGIRLMWGSVSDLCTRLKGLHPDLRDEVALFERAFGTSLYIHLSRRDKIGQAVSRLRAEQSGLWHRYADGTERERTSPQKPEFYDAHRLSTFMTELETDDAAWATFFEQNRIEPLRLTYETLVAAPQDALAGILSALGADRNIAAAANMQTAKLADQKSLEWADRYRREGRREPH